VTGRLLAVAVILALLLAVVAGWTCFHLIRRHGIGPLLWRWFSGHALDGQHRTNATWTQPASKTLHPTGHAVPWHHRPRLHRAAIRTGTTILAAMAAAGLVAAPAVTLTALAIAAAAAVALALWKTVRAALAFRFRYRWVRPLHRALTPALGVPPASLQVTPDRSRVVVALPEGFTGGERDTEEITRAVTAKLAIEAPDAHWALHGKNPQVTFTRSEPPPGRVGFDDIRAAVEAAPAHEVVVGTGKKNALVTVSVDSDSPHMGLSMGSGAGKSTVAKNIAAQMAHHGALLMILDFKLISHQWARGLPNVAYAGLPAEIHAALMWLQDEISRRNQVALRGADIEGVVQANVGPRILVVAEELNATQNRLGAYWKTIREKGDPARSPATEALDEVMFIGRQVNVNVLQIGQRLSAKASGSGDARENLGVKILCDPSAATWKMLCPEHVMPPAAGHLGRVQVVTASAVRETQAAYLTGRQARDFATAGTVAIPRPDMPFTAGLGPVTEREQIAETGLDRGFVTGNPVPVTAGPSAAVTLAEAVDAQLIRMSLAALRQARHRDESFPAVAGMRGAAHLYDIDDLCAWQAGKARAA
jgi:hypothetical protein